MESPAVRVEVKNGPRCFWVDPACDCYGITCIKAAIVWNQSIAASNPSSAFSREEIGPLLMSVRAFNKWKADKLGSWILEFADVPSIWRTVERVHCNSFPWYNDYKVVEIRKLFRELKQHFFPEVIRSQERKKKWEISEWQKERKLCCLKFGRVPPDTYLKTTTCTK